MPNNHFQINVNIDTKFQRRDKVTLVIAYFGDKLELSILHIRNLNKAFKNKYTVALNDFFFIK